MCCEWLLIFQQVNTPNIEQTRKAKLVSAIRGSWLELFGQQTKLAATVAARKLNRHENQRKQSVMRKEVSMLRSRATRLEGLKNVRQKILPNGQTRLSLDSVATFHSTIIFGTSDTILAQRFLGIQQNQCFALFQRRRLYDDVFSTPADEFGDFGAVFGTALKERNQTIGYKKHDCISAYRKAFLLFWRWIFKEETEEIWSWLFFTTWLSWILNFIIKFNNAFTSTLAALDSNLVANLGLRKYSPAFIYTSRLSWWAV